MVALSKIREAEEQIQDARLDSELEVGFMGTALLQDGEFPAEIEIPGEPDGTRWNPQRKHEAAPKSFWYLRVWRDPISSPSLAITYGRENV